MKKQLQIYLFTKDHLIIVILKKYTLIILSTFFNMRNFFQKGFIIRDGGVINIFKYAKFLFFYNDEGLSPFMQTILLVVRICSQNVKIKDNFLIWKKKDNISGYN
jgi:hypothetical protein